MNIAKKISSNLNKGVNGSTIGVFRILFGLLLFEEFMYFHEYFLHVLSASKIMLSYDGFLWLEMLPREIISPFFYLMMTSSLLFAFGVFTRINNVIVLLGFSYVFFLDKGHYNNHYYFYFLVLFLMLFVNASWGGLQNKTKRVVVPYWQLLILQLQIFIVYFYGGVAKINPDWLQGVPMNAWVWNISNDFPEGVREIYRLPATAIVLSYIGLAFDLLAGFALFSRKYKRVFLIFIALFHLQNAYYFNIGTFPYTMLAGTILFANPKYGELIYSKIEAGLFREFRRFLKNKPIKTAWRWFRTKSGAINFLDIAPKRRKVVRFSVASFLILWFIFQALFPLRQYFYNSHPSWSGEGHLFAWRMMLVDTADGVRIWIEDEETGENFPVAIENYLVYRQFCKMTRTPKELLHLAHFIRDEVKEKRGIEPVIRMEIYKSVNFREPALVNDTSLNYSNVEYNAIRRAEWINEWNPSEHEIIFDQEVYEIWRDVYLKQETGN